ncbi:hypothetical protein [Mesorhizobium sp. B1-1-7]|uniref:hypothetical protein n=1 Tax=Mesorhizobium sp. B1-1-7 TaxID=2589977 RepID=UPI0011272D80|nr:hypothetical protein [Mesorhizobium sp. B1-1-7]TPN43237.1 hypothetical protein FJ978_31545 [Mesorhizobium sp. B1-1-7]
MADVFNGHIDRPAFEKALREAFGGISAEIATNPVLACQARATEVAVQFALFVADELNAGTTADILLDAGSRVIGNMVENFARGFEGDEGEDIVATIIDRVRWATTEDNDDDVVEVTRPQTLGGKA